MSSPEVGSVIALTLCRMYRERPEAPKCNAIKDPSAAARSTIRRQASVRGHPSTRYHRSNLHGASYPYRSPIPRAIADEIEREVNGIGRRVRSPLSNNNPIDEPFDLPGALTDSERREAGQRIFSDIIDHRNPGRRMRMSRQNALNDLRDPLAPGGRQGNRQSPETLPFTHRFAPAIAFHGNAISAPPPPDIIRLSPFPRLDGLPAGLSRDTGDDPGSHVSLLRRVGQRSVNEARRANREPVVDGLGDRQRSPTPDDHENDAWETLLTTITPDASLPSADSSFNSASASATNASRNGSSNSLYSQTQPTSLDSAPPTMHMVLEPYPEFLHPCDYPEYENEPDPESDLDAFRSNYEDHFRRAARNHHSHHSTMSSHPPLPPVSTMLSDSSSHQSTHHHIQNILNYLTRGENIPDFVWATAGLPPPPGRRTGANDGSHDADNGDESVRQRTY